MPIFRRRNCIHASSGIFALCRCLYSTQVEGGVCCNATLPCACMVWKTTTLPVLFKLNKRPLLHIIYIIVNIKTALICGDFCVTETNGILQGRLQHNLETSLTFWNLVVTVCIASFNFPKFYIFPAVYMFCMDLRTKSEFCPVQFSVIGFYNQGQMFIVKYKLGL
jgi:hypothetical protein